MKAVVTDPQQQHLQEPELTQEDTISESFSVELSCNSDLVRSYDVLKAVPMGHKDKFYQRILSEQRQALVDVSQSLPNSLHGETHRNDSAEGEEITEEGEFTGTAALLLQQHNLNGDGKANGENGATGQDVWFNTWPERCEKGENGKISPRFNNNQHLLNNTRTIASKPCDNHPQSHSTTALNNGKKVSLNEALQNISLAYSPVTKKLHLIAKNTHKCEHNSNNRPQQTNEQEGLLPRQQTSSDENTQEDEQIYLNDAINEENLKSKESLSNESSIISNNKEAAELIKKTHRRIQDGSFSSTISSISDISLSGSLLDTDTDNTSECSDIGFNKCGKRRGFMQFFNRNVFSPWKSNSSNCSSITSSASTAGVWNLFNKPAMDGNSRSESPKHEAVVASSSALIQLKRPSNLPAKAVEEEQKHRDEYEAMVASAKRKDSLNSLARQKQQKLQLQLEEQQAASAKHFLQIVLPNWGTTRNLKRTRDLWWQGLPSSVRGRVWRKAIGNDLNITTQLYEICLARAQTLIKSFENQSCIDNISNYSCECYNKKDSALNLNYKKIVNGSVTMIKLEDRAFILNRRKSSDDLNLGNRKESSASLRVCGTSIGLNVSTNSRKDSWNDSKFVHRSDSTFQYCRKNSGTSIPSCGTPIQIYNKNANDYHFSASNLTSRRCSISSTECCGGILSLDQQQQANLAAVQLDIARVFPNLCIFQEGGPYSDVLHSLLAAYVCYRPDVGYVQGMAYLAAILTLNLHPIHSFIAFANLLNRPLHLAAYTLDQCALDARYRAFERCLAVQLPKLCTHMAATGLTPDLYLLDWVYTVYAKAMPLDVTSRVWDVWLRDGEEEFVFRTALGILHLYQDQLLTMDFLHGSQFLTRLPEDLSSEQLFRSIRLVSTSIGKQTFAQIVHGFYQYGTNDDDDG